MNRLGQLFASSLINPKQASHIRDHIKCSNLSVLFLIVIFFTLQSQAQEATTTTTIKLILADIISIEPASMANGGTVDFQYENVGDYNSEKINTVKNSLLITFSKPFDLNVKSHGENFENGSHYIPVNVLTIRRNESSQIIGNSSPIILSTQDQILLSSTGVGSKLNLDLDYIIPKARSSSSDILGKPAGTYIQKITYTATAL